MTAVDVLAVLILFCWVSSFAAGFVEYKRACEDLPDLSFFTMLGRNCMVGTLVLSPILAIGILLQ